jgi:hypothetical protein
MYSNILFTLTLAILIFSTPRHALSDFAGGAGAPPPDAPADPSSSSPEPQAPDATNTSSPNTPSSRKTVRTANSEMEVLKLDGTIMVQHADKTKPTALQTGGYVEKGDVITVYDQSWVILRDRRGDRIGLDGNTVLTIDECYIEGPDRQVRLLLQKGTVFLRTNNADSRQTFFEINTGAVVTSLRELEAILSYDPDKSSLLDIKYIRGSINVIDQTHEETFTVSTNDYDVLTRTESNVGANENRTPLEHTEHTWQNGKMMETDPLELDHLDEVNYYKFFDGEPRVQPRGSNILLDDSDMRTPRHR